MTESPEQELEEPRAVEDDRLDLSSQEESLASVDVLREWIAQLKHEISNRDSVIVELKSAIEDASPRSELEEQRVDPCGGCQDTAPTACDGSVRPTSDVEGFHNIEALESAIAERDESISRGTKLGWRLNDRNTTVFTIGSNRLSSGSSLPAVTTRSLTSSPTLAETASRARKPPCCRFERGRTGKSNATRSFAS